MAHKTQRIEKIFWKIIFFALMGIGLSTNFIKGSGFWSSYVLDITGPAWNYILIRGLYKSTSTFLTLKFSAEIALLTIVGICFIIETMQFLELYDSAFDAYDFLAYFSGTLVLYIIDKWLLVKRNL